MNMKFSAPCIFGLEGLCANELRYLGVENVNAENGIKEFYDIHGRVNEYKEFFYVFICSPDR